MSNITENKVNVYLNIARNKRHSVLMRDWAENELINIGKWVDEHKRRCQNE
tara:strand:- start:246 stop:398 length:153 start_codon:yes stop_codon:yes gene_type:complete